MSSAADKDPEAAPLIEVKPQANRGNSSIEQSPSKAITEQLAEKVCCTFRVRVFAIILLLLFQIPIFAYYYRTAYNLDFGNISTRMNPKELWDSYVKEKHKSPSTSKNLDAHLPKTLPVTKIEKDNFDTSKIKVDNKENSAHETVTKLNVEDVFLSDGHKDVDLTINIDPASTTKTTTVATTTSTSTTFSTAIAVQPTTALSSDNSLPLCPETPPKLVGHLAISFDNPPDPFEKTLSENPLLTDGGHGKPPECSSRHKLAIIIPYRDRTEHLKYFVEYMHPILQRQQVDYQIFIINQLGHGQFNRAKLMNAGYLESQKIYPFDCFAFHDVDLILEDDRSLYWCSDRPRHMSAGVDKFNYVLPYSTIFGGVTLLSKKQMDDINGFSNEFWGWGGEDDDVFNRLKLKKYKIVRYSMDIARYKMIRHQREKGNTPNPKRFELIRKTHKTYMNDGLNSIKYKVISTEFHPTYTNITVDLFGPS